MTMADDIVAELDRWLELDMPGDDRGVLRRARDEIVALRKGVASGGWVWEQIQMTHKAARAEALEEAADRVANYFANCDEVVAYIRALKDKP
jgi:hypothetical protein